MSDKKTMIKMLKKLNIKESNKDSQYAEMGSILIKDHEIQVNNNGRISVFTFDEIYNNLIVFTTI